MAVTAALVFAVAAGGTLAANQVETIDEVATPLATQTLELGLAGGGENTEEVLVPGGDALDIEPFTITNTKDIDAYVRVTMSMYWQDESGNQYDAGNVTVNPQDKNAGDWDTAAGAPGSPLVLYYTRPLMAGEGESITPPLESVQLPASVGSEYSGMKLYVNLVADGVQFAGADYQDVNEGAILASWGVTAVTDASGAITSVTYPS